MLDHEVRGDLQGDVEQCAEALLRDGIRRRACLGGWLEGLRSIPFLQYKVSCSLQINVCCLLRILFKIDHEDKPITTPGEQSTHQPCLDGVW